MSYDFATVPEIDIPRSSFDRSHRHLTSINAGYLVPVYLDEVLPGDTFTMNSSHFCRMSTPMKPIMDNLEATIQYFYVPNRLVWEHWDNFLGEVKDPMAVSQPEYVVPQYVFNSTTPVKAGDLASYMGVPIGTPKGEFKVSALPFRAYNLIWNTWYRDENLQSPVQQQFDDEDRLYDSGTYRLLKRGKKKDYFTSALPWPQKFDPPTIPIGGKAPVVGTLPTYKTAGTSRYDASRQATIFTPAGGSSLVGVYNESPNALSWLSSAKLPDSGNVTLKTYPEDVVPSGSMSLFADLGSTTGVDINQLREAVAIQHLLENDARGGTRIRELLLSHFGVRVNDLRVQVPEFLGSSNADVNFTPVQQTSSTSEASPQGNLSAFAISNCQGHFTKTFLEHGWVIGLLSVRARLTYQQGLNRMLSRHSRYDFYWPELANLGEQAILNKEIYCDGSATDDLVFGYQERWAEYRYFPGRVSGVLASTADKPLDIWHVAQKFDTLPKLNASFIEENPPIDRILAVSADLGGAQFICDNWFDLQCARPMPTYSIPGIERL